MDIRQLRYFLGILEAKSVTKAAEVLRVAQPALGLQIRNLERELGVQLLVRHARGVSPTEAGVLLARHAESIVRIFEHAQQDLVDYGKTPRGHVSLGMSMTAAHVLVGPLVDCCHRKFPAVQLTLTEGLSKQLIDLIATDKLDIALMFNPDDHPELVRKPLIDEPLMFLRPAGSERLPASIGLPEMFAHELVLPSRPHLMREIAENGARDAGQSVRIFCEADAVTTMIELVRHGLATTLLPMGVVKAEVANGEIRAQRVAAERFRRTLYIVHSARRPQSKAIDAVCREIEAVVGDLVGAGNIGWTLPRADARRA